MCRLFALLLLSACSSREPARLPSPEPPPAGAGEDGVPQVIARPLPAEAGHPSGPEPVSGDPAPVAAPPVQVDEVGTCDLPPRPRAGEIRTSVDLVFSEAGGTPLRLDLVTPSGDGPHPVVVLVHGGGWRAGEKAHLDVESRVLAGLGYAAATVDYRLVPHRFPAAVADVRCAVRWLRAHAADHDLDPERMGAIGFSAGGHLVALAGLAPEVTALDEGCTAQASSRLSSIVLFFAPTDLRATADWPRPTARIIERFLGVSASEDPTLAALASPIAHVDASDPPTLLVHGTADTTVPIDQSRSLRDALEGVGVATTEVEVEGGGHGFGLFTPRPSLRAAPCTALAFLEAHLR